MQTHFLGNQHLLEPGICLIFHNFSEEITISGVIGSIEDYGILKLFTFTLKNHYD